MAILFLILKFKQMKKLNVSQMESLQGGSWCSESTAVKIAGIAVGGALVGSAALAWIGAGVLYSCVF